MSNQYEVFYMTVSDEWSTARYFGRWHGDTPAEAIAASNVREQPTNHVFIYKAEDAIHFTRTDFEEIEGEDE